MRKFLDRLYQVSGAIAALFLLSICAVVSIQVLSTILDNGLIFIGQDALGLTIPSYGEVTGFFLVTASFLALAYTLRAGGHVRVNLFIRMLSGKTLRAVELFNVIFGIILAAMLTWYTARMVYTAWRFNDLTSGSLVIAEWIPKAPMVIGSAILLIALIDEFFSIISGKEPSYAKGDDGELSLSE